MPLPCCLRCLMGHAWPYSSVDVRHLVTSLFISPLQEFGDSARARKLYEQDSDDDEEDEELEPNPKLEAGETAWTARDT